MYIYIYIYGIAIIKHNSINLTTIKTGSFSSFECIGLVITSSYSAFKFFVIYRPPLSSISTVFTEFESLIECLISSNIYLILAILTLNLIISMSTTLNILTNFYIILV